MAEQIAANPFAKVVTMIADFLKKLKEEAAVEAEPKAWCDEELKKNKLNRDKLTFQQKMLIYEIEVLLAKFSTMAANIQTLIDEQAELSKNEATLADCAAATPTVKKALTALEEFYATRATS